MARTYEPPEVIGMDAAAAPTWLDSQAAETLRALEGPPFDVEEHAARLSRVRARMQAAELDALMVFRPSSIEYLCGFHTAETAAQPLLITESETVLYVPDLEVGRALASSCADQIRFCGYSDALTSLERFIAHAASNLTSGARVGVEMSAPTPPRAVALWTTQQDVVVVDSDHIVERERLVLSPAELRCVQRAAEATAAGVHAATTAAAAVGASDASVGAAIAAALHQASDSISAWGPVVVTGPRSGIPHSSWDGSILAPGPTFLEFSGTCRRYHAPVMRTLVRGDPAATDGRLAELARTMVAAVLETARAGVPASQVAAAAANALGPLPADVMFHQMFGYPVGLAHKPHWMDGAPFFLTEDNHEPLQANMVFHIPASFRAFGQQGVGLSQTFVVEEGQTHVLTHGPADLIHLAT